MKTKLLLIILVLLLPVTYLSAQDIVKPDSINHLNEIVVTYEATRSTPVTYQNISSEILNQKSYGQEPSSVLSETPSITAYSDAGSMQGYSYIRMRGIDQTRINITFDGVPLNEPEDQGAYFSNHPDLLNSVSKIQIQRGVGTSKNGVASYAGSIQLFSPDLHDSTSTAFGIGYGSFNSWRAIGEFNSGIKNRKALYVRASQVYSDGYKYHSHNNSRSILISSGLFYDKSIWKINILSGQQQNNMAWLGVSDSLLNIDRRTNANTPNEKDQFFESLVQVQNKWLISPNSTIHSSIYYTWLKGNYDFDLNNYLGLETSEELYNYAFQSNLFGFYSNYHLSHNRFNFRAGIHANTYNRKHTGSERNLGNLYKNTGFKDEISFFTKADYSLGRFNLYGDLQYRYTSFDYRGSAPLHKMEWNFINPMAGLSYTVNSKTHLYYSAGRTSREPTRNDLFGGNDDLMSDSLGKAQLFVNKPEHVVNHELGLRHSSQRVNFNGNLFYMDFTNEIVLDGKFGPNGLALTNRVDQSIRTGIELSLFYKISRSFSISNSSSYTYSRIKEQQEEFSPILTPPIIVNQEVTYKYKRFSMAVIGRYQDRSFIDFANTATISSYFLLNARVRYTIKNFNISLFANNLTNTRYFNNGYIDFDGSRKLFVQAPVNLFLNIEYRF